MKTTTLEELLNDIQAVCEQKIPGWGYKDLAARLGKEYVQTYTWIAMRPHKPNGEITLAMQAWLADYRKATKA